LHSSLDDITKAFGVTHKGSIDYDTKDFEALIDYNKADCVGLYEALVEFQKLTSSGLALTIASQAQREFKADGGSYEDVQRDIKHEDDFRQAYYGGRVDVFEHEGHDINYYDVNSEYPTAMLNDFPIGYSTATKVYHKGYIGIYYVKWKRPEGLKYGLLPCRNIKTGLVFSYEDGQGWYCSPELDRAYKLGYTIEVVNGYYWKLKRPIFKSVISAWYEHKRGSTGVIREYYKRLLNSLYGRLGIKEESEDILFERPTKAQCHKYEIYPIDNNGKFFSMKRRHHFNNVYVQLAAMITSYARVQLYNLIVESDALYCDTDSVITHRELETSKEMGAIKLECQGDYMGIAPKVMMVHKDNEVIHMSAKGFNKSQVTLSMFKEASEGRFDNFVTVKHGLLGMKRCMMGGKGFLITEDMVRAFRGENKNNFPPLWKVLRDGGRPYKWRHSFERV